MRLIQFFEQIRSLTDGYGGTPVGHPNAQQRTDDLPEFMTAGGQEAYTGEKDVDYKPENIAAEDEASSQPIHKQTYDPAGRVYWDKNLESNKLRMQPGEGADAFLAWIIEAAGDIWREITDSAYQHHGSPEYIIEKIRRIWRSIRYRDWTDPVSNTAPEKIQKISQDIDGLSPQSEPARITKNLLQAIIRRDRRLVQRYSEQLYKALGIDEKYIKESIDNNRITPTELPRETQYDIAHRLIELVPALSNEEPEYVVGYLDFVDMPPINIVTVNPKNLYKQFSNRAISDTAASKYADMVRSGVQFDPVIVNGKQFLDGGHRVVAHILAGEDTIRAVDIGPLISYDWKDAIDGNLSEGPPAPEFDPTQVEIVPHDGMYRYTDGNVIATIDITYGSVAIYEFSSKESGKGYAVKALSYLKNRFGSISVTDIGYPGDDSYKFWMHVLKKGLVDYVYDVEGRMHEKPVIEGPLAPEFDPTQARYDPELELGRSDQRQAGYNRGHPSP